MGGPSAPWTLVAIPSDVKRNANMAINVNIDLRNITFFSFSAWMNIGMDGVISNACIFKTKAQETTLIDYSYYKLDWIYLFIIYSEKMTIR